jgi:hypothetical protein
MRTAFSAVLCLVAASAFAADRIVLFEDFTNSGCGPCWSVEPQVNAFVNAHLAAGDLAVLRCHVDWPSPSDPIYLANPAEQNARKAVYGVSSVPTFKMDGVLTPNAGGLENAFNTRSAVPTYLDIHVVRNGDDETGIIGIRLIAEQDLQNQANMRLFSVIVEDNVPGVGYWAGSVFEQAFRDNLTGYPYGDAVEFEAPYPDTLYFEADYDITAWVNDELHLATFVQQIGPATKEVMNAHYAKFMDLQTGIGDGTPESVPGMTIGPNPTSGTLSVLTQLPGSVQGMVYVYDLSGHRIASAAAEGQTSFQLDESGIYFVRLVTDTGVHVTRTVTVLN